MIAAIEGILESRGTNWGIIKVGGVSLQIHLPTSTLSQLGAVGEKVQLHTHLHVKGDNIALYGFASQEERELFEMLISVDGIGPKVALAVLSTLNAEQLATAITNGDIDILTQVSSLGKKTASRLVLELKGKLGKSWTHETPSYLTQENADIVAALTNLGYSVSQATRVVAEIPHSPNLTLEDKLKLALQHIARG